MSDPALPMSANLPPERPAIVVRRPRIDLAGKEPQGLAEARVEDASRYWWGGDPFKTHFLNALSSTFPFGEAFFVRSVRHFADRVDDPQLLEEIRVFAGQEGQHSRIHDEHVDLLITQGYRGLATRNRFIDTIMKWHNRRTPRFSLAVTAALEHLTAILARQVLENREGWIDDMSPEMAALWRWHALEETEHKSVAFDVMLCAEIPFWMRNFAMALNTIGLGIETLERMIYMFWKDGRLFEGRAWTQGFRFLFGQKGSGQKGSGRMGFLRGVGRDYLAWYRRDFHPEQIDDRELIAHFAPLVTAEVSA